MKEWFRGVMLFISMAGMSALAEADTLDKALESRFDRLSHAQFLSYENIEHADDYGALRYLVMDFETHSTSDLAVQSHVHSICLVVLNDLDLIRNLSDQGYDMISVSFDRKSQYDCL